MYQEGGWPSAVEPNLAAARGVHVHQEGARPCAMQPILAAARGGPFASGEGLALRSGAYFGSCKGLVLLPEGAALRPAGSALLLPLPPLCRRFLDPPLVIRLPLPLSGCYMHSRCRCTSPDVTCNQDVDGVLHLFFSVYMCAFALALPPSFLPPPSLPCSLALSHLPRLVQEKARHPDTP
jgi:hypothetical protein